MKARRIFNVLCLFLIGTVILVGNEAGAVQRRSKPFYSFKFGYYGEGTMTVKNNETDWEADFDTESGVALGFAIDVPTGEWLMAGFAFDMNEIKFPGDNTMAYNFVGTLKADIRTTDRKFAIRPGIGGGAALVPEVGYVDNSLHFTLRGTNEFIYLFERGGAILGEVGLIWDLHGTGGDYTVHGGPFLFIRGGFGF